MGSNGPPPPISLETKEEITVVITGFQPFKEQYPINPSWSIVSSLPPFILPSSPLDLSPCPVIRLLVHPSPVRVSYPVVRELVPKLWEESDDESQSESGGKERRTGRPRKIDFMIHVGMAGGRDFYSVERRGRRDGYVMTDVDGVVLGDEKERFEAREEEGWVWEGCPEMLETSLDVDDLWMRWRSALPDIDVRPSDDAGRYLCDFIYYSSLSHLWKTHQDRRVVFLHVPVDSDDVAVARGREVLLELIRAMVQSRKMSSPNCLRRENEKDKPAP